jgi:hypothetical protein
MYIVRLEKCCWLADWDGDPGRTVVKENARVFPTYETADMAIREAREYRPFKNAVVAPFNDRTTADMQNR